MDSGSTADAVDDERTPGPVASEEGNRVALVTGAAGLLGTATCAALEGDGWSVAALDYRDPPPQTRWFRCCDISDPISVTTALRSASLELGPVHAVVHCAGLNDAVEAWSE